MSTNKKLTIASVVFAIVSFAMISCATKSTKMSRPFNPANTNTASNTVTFNLQTSKLLTGNIYTTSGDITIKAVKKVPVPKQFKKNKINTQTPIYNLQVKITYTVWTPSQERTAKVLSTLTMQNPYNLGGAVLDVDTTFAQLQDEFSADIEILYPKNLDVQWFGRTGDGKVDVK